MNTTLGPYNLIGTLGRGGMGVVYKAYETSLNRFVAVKMLAEALVNDASVKERFLREARSMASLNDPHIIQIYFIGDDAGQSYFVMEYVDGESLGSLLKREAKLKPEQAAKIIFQTAQGLSTAHDKGVIHRDIKPGNLMITSRGSVKIADFGIALTTQDFSKKLTSTGEFVGTPGYLSPEVCLGKPVDQRSDIFSLGIVLFECLAGRMPFTDESPLGLMLEVVKAEIPDVCTLNAEVDPELSRILGKMIAKDPAERYQNCHELVEDLGKYPLVAKGGALGLATAPGMLEPLRRTAPRAAVAAMASTSVTARAAPSSPTRASALRPGSRSPRYWAAGAALALVAVASAWAFRADLPFAAPLFGAAVESQTGPTQSGTAQFGTAPNDPATVTREGAANASATGADATSIATATSTAAQAPADGADAALLDALWLEDVPDDALAAAAADLADASRFAYAGPYSGVNYAIGGSSGGYPSSAPANAIPPGYFSAAPWRVGFGIGIGYWATRIAAAPIYAGPAFRPGLGLSGPFSGAPIAVAEAPVGFANHTLTPMPAAPQFATPAPAANFVHNASNPAVLASEHPRRAANLAAANTRRLGGAVPLVVRPAAVHAAVIRERALPPHPKAERH